MQESPAEVLWRSWHAKEAYRPNSIIETRSYNGHFVTVINMILDWIFICLMNEHLHRSFTLVTLLNVASVWVEGNREPNLPIILIPYFIKNWRYVCWKSGNTSLNMILMLNSRTAHHRYNSLIKGSFILWLYTEISSNFLFLFSFYRNL